METPMRRTLPGLILALWLLSAASSPAQFAQPVQPGGTISSVPLPSTSFAPAPYAPRPVFPTAFGYPYGGVYVENPISGYFNGVANLTSAYGQYQQDYQKGRLLNQEVERSKLATRRA